MKLHTNANNLKGKSPPGSHMLTVHMYCSHRSCICPVRGILRVSLSGSHLDLHLTHITSDPHQHVAGFGARVSLNFSCHPGVLGKQFQLQSLYLNLAELPPTSILEFDDVPVGYNQFYICHLYTELTHL